MALPASHLSPPSFVLRDDEVALATALADMSEPALITRADLAAPGPTIIAVSSGMVALNQYRPDELLGRSPRLFQGPLTARAVLDELRSRCLRAEQFVGETVNYRRDGSTYLVQWTIDPLRDAEGRVTHFFSLQRDVTERRRYAREWLAAEEKVRAALAGAGTQLAAIAEAIAVLEKSKRSFRSKELGELAEPCRVRIGALTCGGRWKSAGRV
jgi:PAS domain S-box-containing protein